MDTNMQIAPIIRDIRNQLGLTQQDLAGQLGITSSTINRWERGHAKPSKLARESLVRVAGCRGVDVSALTLSTSS
jgi:transcriptional regulator with XRE-family HTH domain